ncbi:hypothetical protein EON65_16095 [archaeon]|nr:MAG: hypothetical protein EON65_16095 [archaeon]
MNAVAEISDGQPTSIPTILALVDITPTSRPSGLLTNAPVNTLDDMQPTSFPTRKPTPVDISSISQAPISQTNAPVNTLDGTQPTSFPTRVPSSSAPTEPQPTSTPSVAPTFLLPTSHPTSSPPTPTPTLNPTHLPTLMPTTSRPSIAPSQAVLMFISNITFHNADVTLPLSYETQSALLKVNALCMMIDGNSQFFSGATLVVSQTSRMYKTQAAQLKASIATELPLSSPYTNEVAVEMYTTLSSRLKDAVDSGYFTNQLQLEAEQRGLVSMTGWTAVQASSRMLIPTIPDIQASDQKDEELTLTYAILVLFGFLACVAVTFFAYVYWKSREPMDMETDRLLSRNRKAEEEVEMGVQRTSKWLSQYEKL